MLVVVPGAIATNGVHGAQGTASGLTDEDARAIVQEVASVESAAPMLSAGVQGVVGDLNDSTRASGTTPDYFRVRNWPIASGALFDDADVTLGTKVCVIGETVRRSLFPGVTPIGSLHLAIGAQRGDILSQFLTEAVVLSALGGLSGLALGAIASFLLSLLTHWGVRIQIGSSLVAVAVATSVGLVFGFFPARRAAHLDPIVAL